MRTLFIADCHLAPGEDAKARSLCRFLMSATGARTLYVLGDLFEIWTGPADLDEPAFAGVLDAVRAIGRAGTPVTFLRGNRDFLLGRSEENALGLSAVLDEHTITLGEKRVLLAHGDLFCARDRHYQEYRRIVRSRPVSTVLKRLPRGLGRRVGEYFRRQSASIVRHKGARMTDLAPAALADAFERTGCDVIVCGHVHRRQERRLTVDGRERHVYVLGAWDDNPAALVYEKGKFAFEPVE